MRVDVASDMERDRGRVSVETPRMAAAAEGEAVGERWSPRDGERVTDESKEALRLFPSTLSELRLLA